MGRFGRGENRGQIGYSRNAKGNIFGSRRDCFERFVKGAADGA